MNKIQPILTALRRLLPSGFLAAAMVLTASGAHCAEPDQESYEVTPSLVRQMEKGRYFGPMRRTEELERSRARWKKAWIASWISYAAVSVLDTHSSMGKREINPLLRGATGGFSAGKAAGVKSALGLGMFYLQHRSIRKHPEENYYRRFAIVTGASAGALGAVAVHNYGVNPQQ